jgi:predicted nucleic acid-binding protein
MTIVHKWVVLDTNVWIFGLRESSERPACIKVLQRLPRLYVLVPWQVLLELRANLTRDEMDHLFRLLNRYPAHIQIHWEKVESILIYKYQQLGCKLGDATVAAHVEALGVDVLVSENRDFLAEIKGLPFLVFSAEEVLQELGEIEETSKD